MIFNNKKIPSITFTNVYGYHESSGPIPATKIIPDWYKKTASYFPKKKLPTSEATIKRCMPVFDALTAGYILTTPCDIYVTIKDEEPFYTTALPNVLEFHPFRQGTHHPNGNSFQYPKFINGWAIKTPKGYSSLFIPPMHNPNPWFQVLEGIVDTDAYHLVHFPFVLKTPIQEGVIPQGTPMVQIIPFKREKWNMLQGDESNVKEYESSDKAVRLRFFDRYKDMFRTPKEWS